MSRPSPRVWMSGCEAVCAADRARDRQDAAAAGIKGTPTFVIGRAAGDKVTGMLMVGAKLAAVFEAEIEKLLSTK